MKTTCRKCKTTTSTRLNSAYQAELRHVCDRESTCCRNALTAPCVRGLGRAVLGSPYGEARHGDSEEMERSREVRQGRAQIQTADSATTWCCTKPAPSS